jgi:hypothetical protein|nr:MAG TPA: Transcription initiation factor IIE, alpha FINGER, Transcription [Caudoviricetes sp.]
MSKYTEALSSIYFTMHNRVKPKTLGHCEDKNLEVLEELVERATPKPVNKKRAIMSLLKTHILLHTGHCPICDKAVSHSSCVEKDGLFCNDCGQALDWGDNETT